jgi:AAT family amino acid transporter
MQKAKLHQQLTSRHIVMIALGSSIGTGFFFGTNESIRLTGPSILLAYLLGGLMMYFIVRALGEMCVAEPSSGSFSYYAHQYIGPFAGYFSGWNYWFNYIIVCMIELTACGLFLDYWFPNSSHWLINLCIMLSFLIINGLSVRVFGEIEFWFAGIKVLAVMSLIIFGGFLLIRGTPVHHVTPSVRHLWQNGGFFAQGLSGFLCSLVVVLFSFGGTELVGITAGETEHPKKNIPLAINGIIGRIILFYVATLAIVLCMYPWQKLHAHVSPFVDVFEHMGIPKAAALMNFVALTAALSSLNSGIYGTGRMLYNLGLQGNAPSWLTQLSKHGTPNRAILVSMSCIAVAVILNYLFPHYVFNLLLAVATIAAIMNWTAILVTHFYFKSKSLKHSSFPMLAYPYSSIAAFLFLITVTIGMYTMSSFRLAILIGPLWVSGLSLSYLIKLRVRR